MRHILNKDQAQKATRKNTLILGIFLIIIMVFSTIGYAFYSSDNSNQQGNSIDYNGIEFQQTSNQRWSFKVQGNIFNTKFNPYETENISVIITKNIDDFYNKPLYFGINSIEDVSYLGNVEILNNIQGFLLRSGLACLSQECTEDYAIKNCSENNVIIFKKQESQISRVREEEGCIVIYYQVRDGDNGEEERLADAFLFKILKIN